MSAPFDQLRTAYASFEPEGADTWNPLRNDVELWHRVRLLLELTAALRLLSIPPGELRVLDVGCGVGRSSRLLVELGVLPENILAIDLRPEALALARQLNPAIRYRAIADWGDWPVETFDLCLQCTAFSSLAGEAARVRTAGLMERSVGPDGHIFWWDIIRANGLRRRRPPESRTSLLGAVRAVGADRESPPHPGGGRGLTAAGSAPGPPALRMLA